MKTASEMKMTPKTKTTHLFIRWEGYSAGSKPTGKVHPGAVEILARHQVRTEGYTSKQWDKVDHIKFDIIITVCDNAAAEVTKVRVEKYISVSEHSSITSALLPSSGTPTSLILDYSRLS